jgi:hypothetical protein
MEKLLIGRSGALLQQSVLGKIDRSTSGKISIDRSTFQDFRISVYFSLKFVISLLMSYKTQKLAKTLENNKAKYLTSVNQGVQIHNI